MHRDWVLVTGYPGFEARKLVEHLLAVEPTTHVALLVQNADEDAVGRHLERVGDDRARVELFEGDPAALDMGLSGAELGALARRVTRIHHVAHLSHVGADRRTATRVNVQGAVEAIAVARACHHLECLVHHSTAHVSGDRAGLVYEDELDESQGFHGVVQETRMTAELVMRRAMSDLPIAVIRPTMMVGDSDTGEVERFDGPYLLVMLLLGLPGDLAVPLPTGADNPLDIVPVDHVVKAARAIGTCRDARGRTFHLASSEQLTAREVFERIARAGGKRTASRSLLPRKLASALSRTPALAKVLQEPRALLQQLVTKARYDTRNADRILAQHGLVCPPLDAYVTTLVAAVQERFRERAGDRSTLDPEG
ncbi:MAG: SDR family oxidoreductase [Deltaproteobacteria bacterium]|nr:SDR family oxidoreductase [Deltaproteobacteria bacterium]